MLTFDFRKINLPSEPKVLDVGCGEGRHIFGCLHEFQNIFCIGLDHTFLGPVPFFALMSNKKVWLWCMVNSV